MSTVRSRLRKIIRAIFYISPAKKLLETVPVIRNVYAPAQRTHPIDRMYGIDTSGVVPVENIHPDQSLHSQIIAYVGSQPSIVRRALSALGDIRDYVFVDLGCGKGRANDGFQRISVSRGDRSRVVCRAGGHRPRQRR
jgi:hypothetical protein